MLDEFNCLTLKILCRTAMGVDVGKENPETGFTLNRYLTLKKSLEPLKRFQSVQT